MSMHVPGPQLALLHGSDEALLQSEDVDALNVIVDTRAQELSSFNDFHTRLVAHRDRLVARSAPIRNLPVDVLRLVFETGFVETGDKHHYYPVRDSMAFAIRAASVCQLWRDIAIRTSLLWTDIYVLLDRERSLVTLRSFIERAQSRKLDIAIEDPIADGSLESSVLVSGVILFLMKYIDAWRSVRIDSWDLDTSRTITSLWGTQANALEELSLICHDEPRTYFFLDMTAPRLRTLSLREAPCLPYNIDLSWYFPLLEELVLEGVALELLMGPDEQCMDVMQLLAALPHLRNLELSWLRPGSSFAPRQPFTRLSLPVLERITFGSLRLDDVCAFMSVFEAPRLAKMRYFFPCMEDNYSFPPAIRNHTIHFPQLHTLVIECEPHAELKVDSSFSLFLQDFRRIELVNHSDNELSQLIGLMKACTPEGGWTLPRLVSVEILQRSGIPVEVLRQAVEARYSASLTEPTEGDKQAPTAIKQLHVCTPVALSDEDRGWFQQAVRTFTWSEEDSNVTMERATELWDPNRYSWMRISFAPRQSTVS